MHTVIWLTGLSGAGKSTIADALKLALIQRGRHSHILDGDALRAGLCADLGFAEADRTEQVRRAACIAKLMAEDGCIVIVALITPLERLRQLARFHLPDMIEVFINTPLRICEERDPKGLYRKARSGEILNFTGISDPFEEPQSPDIVCSTDRESPQQCVGKLLDALDVRTLALPPLQAI